MKQKTIAEVTKCLVAVSMGEKPPKKTWIEVIMETVEKDFKEVQKEISDKNEIITLLREFVEETATCKKGTSLICIQKSAQALLNSLGNINNEIA